MSWQSTPFTMPMIAAGLISLALAGYVGSYGYRRGFDRTLLALVAVLVLAAEWAFTDALRLASVPLSQKLFWRHVGLIGAQGVVVAWLAFVFAYTDRDEWLTVRRFGPIIGFLIVTITLDILNPGSMLWTSASTARNGEFSMLLMSVTAVGRTISLTYLALALVGVYFLFRLVFGPQKLYRGQATALALSTVFPMLAYILGLLDLGPYPEVNKAALGFVATGAALTFAILRYRLLDLVPVVRDSVVEIMEEGYLVVNEDGRIIDCNPAARKLLNCARDPVGQPIETLFDGDVGGELQQGNETPVGREITVETNQGRRHLSIRGSPLDREGVSHLYIVQDVTDRRQIERRYQKLIEHASDVTAVIDRKGQFDYVSPAVERLLGYDPEALVGRQAIEIVVPADRDHVQAAVEEVVDEPGRSTQFEFRLEDADGTVRVFETVIRNLTHERAVDGFVLNAWEVTERKERARKLEVLTRILRHDIRNDLQIIRLTSQVLESNVETDLIEDVERLQTSTDHAIDLTETVGDLVDAMDTADETVHSIPLVPMVQAEIERLRETTESETVTVEGTLPDVEVVANEMFSSVIRNLLTNAVRHNDTDEPRVTVRTERATAVPESRRSTDDPVTTDAGLAADDDWVVVRVADNGPGVPDERKDEVFGRGEQGLESEGTGIGLYLVRTLVENYGGDVWIEDNDPRGAVFVISLPIAEESTN